MICYHYDCQNRNSFGCCLSTVCINEKYAHEWAISTDNKTTTVDITKMTPAVVRRVELADITDDCIEKIANAVVTKMKIMEGLKQEAQDE